MKASSFEAFLCLNIIENLKETLIFLCCIFCSFASDAQKELSNTFMKSAWYCNDWKNAFHGDTVIFFSHKQAPNERKVERVEFLFSTRGRCFYSWHTVSQASRKQLFWTTKGNVISLMKNDGTNFCIVNVILFAEDRFLGTLVFP